MFMKNNKNEKAIIKNSVKAVFLLVLACVTIIIGIGIGSVFISPMNIIQILKSFLFSTKLPEGIDHIYYGVVTGIRLPRVLMAFLTGAALSVSGTVMQSVLKNPLASSYGLGVSSGAGLGATVVMITGITSSWFGALFLPVVGTVFGLGAVMIAVGFAARMDRLQSNNTIILSGMVISLFLNAIMNMLATAYSEYTNKILLWQLGTFSGKEWNSIGILAVVTVICLVIFQKHSKELDIMTFGEEQALIMGVDLKKEKNLLILITSFLTGTAVSFVGIIGFVDLIAPHVVRRFFGSSHKWVLPMSALFGGAFMVVCDLAGRTIASPSEIPVGSITALLGTPFFLYIYFLSRRKG